MKPLHIKLMHHLHETYLPKGTIGTIVHPDGCSAFQPDTLPPDWPFEHPYFIYSKITYFVLPDTKESTCPSK
jgi:hypothetical protein